MAITGINSFLLDCHTNDNISEIEAEFGVKGFAIVVRLWQKIYSEKGYYCEWTKRSPLLFLANWFGGNSGVTVSLINEIVDRCLSNGIFDAAMHEQYSILTSHRIQEQYFGVVKRREEILVKKEYLLVSVAKIKGIAYENDVSACRIPENVCGKETSEVKGSKEKNNIVAATAKPQTATTPFADDSFEIRCTDMVISSCLQTFPNSKVPRTQEEKQKWAMEIGRMKRLDGRQENEIMQALNYAITDAFWKTNIRSTKKFREKFETLIVQSRGKGNRRNNFNHFKQNQYDFDALEKELLSN